jgi:hypothetical protein
MWRERSSYLFLAPGILIFSVFTFGAFAFAIWLTFRRWSIIEPEKPWVGTQNYEDLLQDERFHQAIFNTVYFTGASVPLSMAIGLLLALLLNQPLRGRGVRVGGGVGFGGGWYSWCRPAAGGAAAVPRAPPTPCSTDGWGQPLDRIASACWAVLFRASSADCSP